MEPYSDKSDVLKKYFGHTSFRFGQEEIIDNLLAGKDVLCVMPTGAGKSMCYQIPALMREGVTLVISPLISLMHDQVMALCASGIAAAYINSSLTSAQYRKVLDRLVGGMYKLVYAAPERLDSESFLAACRRINITMVAVDEAHCVSQWGQDFRPSYLNISGFVESLPVRPAVGAFTATATEKVKTDIISLLKLKDPCCITTGFDRPNLFFEVRTPKSKTAELLSIVKSRQGQSGIVYCSTRRNVMDVCEVLVDNNIRAVRYHAGLDEAEKKSNQNDFVYDKADVMVATNAFGMGIDKSNVSYIVHYNMPKDIESYYQEAGRAGRDGSEAECILLYSPKDVRTAQFLIENSSSNEEITEETQKEIRLRDELRLKYMTFYCTTTECLRSFLLGYFGEKHPGACGKCSNCMLNYEKRDITVDAQKILSCIVRTRQKFGVRMICDILRGSENARIKTLGFDKLSTYGIMKEYSEERLRSIISALISADCIQQTDSEYPVLTLGAASYAVLKGEKKIETKVLITERSKKKRGSVVQESELFIRLKALRKSLADKASVPAYVVFSDAVLREIAEIKPKTKRQFASISGVGAIKLNKYADAFIGEIINYENEHSDDQ